jgi:hypothetical protein
LEIKLRKEKTEDSRGWRGVVRRPGEEKKYSKKWCSFISSS